jgi:Ca2+-binding EF-hand superfamily protein
MQALFKMIDKDSNGFVEKEELLELLESILILM